jgi:hypothetical protein
MLAQVFEEEDEEVQDAEAAEDAPEGPDSSQLAPSRRQKPDGQAPGVADEEEEEDEDGEAVSVAAWLLRGIKCVCSLCDLLLEGDEANNCHSAWGCAPAPATAPAAATATDNAGTYRLQRCCQRPNSQSGFNALA